MMRQLLRKGSRMKKLLIGLVTFSAVTGVAFASGSLGIFGSYWNPKNFDSATGLGGKLQLGSKSFVLELRGGSVGSVKGKGDLKDVDLEVNPFEVGVALRAGDKGFSPYLGAGVGYYLLNGNADKGHQFQVDDVVGWYAVGGLEIPLGDHSAIHAEVQYRDVTGTAEGDSLSGIKDEKSLDLSGVVFSAGLVIRF
jgi:hypothetical protein